MTSGSAILMPSCQGVREEFLVKSAEVDKYHGQCEKSSHLELLLDHAETSPRSRSIEEWEVSPRKGILFACMP
jgi:hypothetical protein